MYNKIKGLIVLTAIAICIGFTSLSALTDYSESGWKLTTGGHTFDPVTYAWEIGKATNLTKEGKKYTFSCKGLSGTCYEIDGKHLTINEGIATPADPVIGSFDIEPGSE
jgi:hypothetical protein